MCQLWALHVVIKRQFFTFIFIKNELSKNSAWTVIIGADVSTAYGQ